MWCRGLVYIKLDFLKDFFNYLEQKKKPRYRLIVCLYPYLKNRFQVESNNTCQFLSTFPGATYSCLVSDWMVCPKVCFFLFPLFAYTEWRELKSKYISETQRFEFPVYSQHSSVFRMRGERKWPSHVTQSVGRNLLPEGSVAAANAPWLIPRGRQIKSAVTFYFKWHIKCRTMQQWPLAGQGRVLELDSSLIHSILELSIKERAS